MENEMIIKEAVTDNIPVAQEIVKDTVPTLEQAITDAPAPAKHSFGKTIACLMVLGAIIAFKPIKNRVNTRREAKQQEEERRINEMVDARVEELLAQRFAAPDIEPDAEEQITPSNEETNKDE